jgi:hypothetical protein
LAVAPSALFVLFQYVETGLSMKLQVKSVPPTAVTYGVEATPLTAKPIVSGVELWKSQPAEP